MSQIIIILSLVSILTSIVSGTIGMGGGVLLLSVMTFFLPLQTIIPIHGICQLVSNSSRTFLLRHKVDKKILIPYIIGAPFGTFFAVYFIKNLSNPNYAFSLIVILIFYVLFKPKKLPKINLPKPSFVLVGLLAGFLGPLIGATGPLLAVFFLRDDLQKEEIVATKAASQLISHLIKVPAFLYLSFPYMDYYVLIITMSLANIIGTFYGIKLLKKLPEIYFTYLYKSALLLAGVRITYKIMIS